MGDTPRDGRIESLDVVRGLAVLGILVINIWAYALPIGDFANAGAVDGRTNANIVTWAFSKGVVIDKMWMLLAILVGAGLFLTTTRAEDRGERSGPLWYRRMGALLLLGLAHAYLLWFGDILAAYALAGMLVYPVRRLSPKRLLTVAALLLAVEFGLATFTQPPPLSAVTAAGAELEASAFQGDWWDGVRYRVDTNDEMFLDPTMRHTLWRSAAGMLIGIAFAVSGVIQGRASRRTYRRILLAGYGIGVPVSASYLLGLVDMRVRTIGSVFLAVGYLVTIVLIVRAGYLRRARNLLSRVGRLALSNYIGQTVVCSAIFYGWGLGLWGKFGMSQLAVMVVAIWALQIAMSSLWLRRFDIGPLEWLWRSLTSGKPLTFRRADLA